MTDEKTTDDVAEQNWREKYVVTIEAGNTDGFDFFEARGDALRFSQIKPEGDWELQFDNAHDHVAWRRKEVASENWKRS